MIKRPHRSAQRGKRFIPSGTGVAMADENLAFIPASCKLKPLGDRMIVEPLDVVRSRILVLPPSDKTLRGRVLAVGPGHYPAEYRDKQGNRNPQRHERAQMVAGKAFVPSQTRVGDIVRLEGFNSEGFFWGDTYCVHAREQDVCGVEV